MPDVETIENAYNDEITVEQWLAVRKEKALKIDPETAEVCWTYGQIMDPYGVDPDLPDELRQVGRTFFARSVGTDSWVSFSDLPPDVCKALWERSRGPVKWELDDEVPF
jgi:hypothetical protein